MHLFYHLLCIIRILKYSIKYNLIFERSIHSSYVKNVELAERIERKMMKDLILYNRRYVLCSIGMSTEDVELDQPSLYCILKLHKLMGLMPNAPWNLFPIYKHQLYQRSKPGFKITVKLAFQGVMWIRCGFWKILKFC